MQETQTLIRAGYDVFVFAWDRYAEFPSKEVVDGAEVRSFTPVNLTRFSGFGLVLGGLLFQIILALEILKLVRRLKQRPIIHAHDLNTLLPSCILRILRLSSALVYDCRELTYGVYSGWFNPLVAGMVRVLEERCLRYADCIITVSDWIANYLRAFNPSVELIYNCPRLRDIPGISTKEARLRLALPQGAFIVSYVGMIRYGCRLELLLAVTSLLKDQNVHFVVVGDGPLAAEFRQAANRAKNARLIVVPRVQREIAFSYVIASDLTWVLYQDQNPSLNVAMPWKLFESMACGVPVIVGAGTLRARLVEKLKCGVILESDEPSEIAEAILSLANDPERHHEMSIAGKQASIADFNWEAMSGKLIDVYRRLQR